jgi:hypothetical protein
MKIYSICADVIEQFLFLRLHNWEIENGKCKVWFLQEWGSRDKEEE